MDGYPVPTYLFLLTWIRIRFKRIRIQRFSSLRIRVQILQNSTPKEDIRIGSKKKNVRWKDITANKSLIILE